MRKKEKYIKFSQTFVLIASKTTNVAFRSHLRIYSHIQRSKTIRETTVVIAEDSAVGYHSCLHGYLRKLMDAKLTNGWSRRRNYLVFVQDNWRGRTSNPRVDLTCAAERERERGNERANSLFRPFVLTPVTSRLRINPANWFVPQQGYQMTKWSTRIWDGGTMCDGWKGAADRGRRRAGRPRVDILFNAESIRVCSKAVGSLSCWNRWRFQLIVVVLLKVNRICWVLATWRVSCFFHLLHVDSPNIHSIRKMRRFGPHNFKKLFEIGERIFFFWS